MSTDTEIANAAREYLETNKRVDEVWNGDLFSTMYDEGRQAEWDQLMHQAHVDRDAAQTRLFRLIDPNFQWLIDKEDLALGSQT